MSFIGDLAFDDQRSLEQDALANPATAPVEPSFWDGSGSALFQGIAQGAGQLALQAAQYGNDPTQAIMLDIPTDEEEIQRRENIAKQRHDLTESLRPDAQTSGTAAQVLFGLGDTVTRFGFGLASGGLPVAAATVGTSMGEQRFSELKQQGVDTGTAALAGAIEGSTLAVGAFLPAARLLSAPAADLAATAGANVALGAVARGGVGAVLEKNGYTDQARQYQALDGTAMAIDGLLGGAFWGLGRAMSRAPSPETIDAALAGNNGLHAQHGTAPGAPVDARSSAAHQNALDLAIDQMARGEPVSVAGVIDGATFIRGDRVGPDADVIRQQAQQDVFAPARAELEPVAAAGLPNVRDLRTELAALNRSLDENRASHDSAQDAYRDTAKQYQREGMSRKQAERAARDSVAANRQALDLQAASAQSRIGDINQALEGNRASERAKAELAAMDRGETPARLERQVQERAEQIGNGFKRSALASSVAPDHGQAMNRQAADEIQRLLKAGGQIIDDVPVQSILDDAAPTAVAARDPEIQPTARGVDQSEAQQQPAMQEPEAQNAQSARRQDADDAITVDDSLAGIDPALPALVDSIIAGERDIQIPTGAINEDGSPATVSARDLLDEADGAIAQANKDSKGFLAAALCSLRFGD